MPFIDCEEWEKQFFSKHNYFSHHIPTSDVSAWSQYPEHRWVYLKNRICETQYIEWYPSGVLPNKYPVFSKPVFNLYGMGAQAFRIDSEDEYRYIPGHIITDYFTGDHISTDIAVSLGEIRWFQHTKGNSIGFGAFDYWELLTCPIRNLCSIFEVFVWEHLFDFTGIINIETIGDRIIEVHLRMSCQWVDLYSNNWIPQIIDFYKTGKLTEHLSRPSGYSVAVFSDKCIEPLNAGLADQLVKDLNLSSIQRTTYLNEKEAIAENPDYGIRVAVINGRNLNDCRKAAKTIRREIEI